MNVLVLGGYGVFGTRLCELLCRDGHDVWIAGRDLTKAKTLATCLNAHPVYIDRNHDLSTLSAVKAEVVVDASGPFQSYGVNPYCVAEYCIDHGINYIDLSDCAEFTTGIEILNSRAKQSGCYVLSGASSVPAVSAAAVAELSKDLHSIASIDTAILPGNSAPRGYSVVESILSRAGLNQKVWRGGTWRLERSWTAKRHYTFSNGHTRTAKTVSVPDNSLFPEHFKAQTVNFRAGQELALLNRAVDAIAGLNRLRQKPPPKWFIKLCHTLSLPTKPFGSDQGGMVVNVVGQSDDSLKTNTWQLWATQGDGPYMPAVTARALLQKNLIPAGARPCITDITLDELRQSFADLNIAETAYSEKYTPVFEKALGSKFYQLPQSVQFLHSQVDYATLSGIASVTRGEHWLSRLIANLIGFPKAAKQIAVSVEMTCSEQQEIWCRTFGGKSFSSVLTTEQPDHFRERFGPLTFEIQLVVINQAITMPVRKGWFLGIPVPLRLLPKSETREYEEDGRFCFDVALSAPVCGLLVHYKGYLNCPG